MSATAIRPAVLVLPDPRPARGKHRTRPSLADAVLGTWRRARLEVAIGAATVGAVLASVLA